VVFGLETTDSPLEQFSAAKSTSGRKLASVIAADSNNTVINQPAVATDIIIYLNTNKELTGTFVNPTTIEFGSDWLTAPLGIPATSIDNFTFFCNGQFIEKTAIVSFTQSGGKSSLVISKQQLGYDFELSDEVIAIGKFK
jgi:hypothetical protein